MAPRSARASSSLTMAVKDLPGVQLPLFSVFDPLGFANCDEKTLSKYREAELKHSRYDFYYDCFILIYFNFLLIIPFPRDNLILPLCFLPPLCSVAMLAVLGVLTQDRFHPVYDGLNSGNPLKAIEGVPIAGWTQIFFVIGVTEYCFAQVHYTTLHFTTLLHIQLHCIACHSMSVCCDSSACNLVVSGSSVEIAYFTRALTAMLAELGSWTPCIDSSSAGAGIVAFSPPLTAVREHCSGGHDIEHHGCL